MRDVLEGALMALLLIVVLGAAYLLAILLLAAVSPETFVEILQSLWSRWEAALSLPRRDSMGDNLPPYFKAHSKAETFDVAPGDTLDRTSLTATAHLGEQLARKEAELAALLAARRGTAGMQKSGVQSVASVTDTLGVEPVLDLNEYPHDEPGYVYVIHSRTSGLYKIGRSSSPTQRIKTMRTADPTLQPVLIVLTADAPLLEGTWHARLVDKRGRGEWFNLTPKDIAQLEGACNPLWCRIMNIGSRMHVAGNTIPLLIAPFLRICS
jgi:hypothetical protein